MGLTGPGCCAGSRFHRLPLMLSSGVRSAVLRMVTAATVAAYVRLGGSVVSNDGLASAYDVMAGGAILVRRIRPTSSLAGIQRVVVSRDYALTTRGGSNGALVALTQRRAWNHGR